MLADLNVATQTKLNTSTYMYFLVGSVLKPGFSDGSPSQHISIHEHDTL